MPVLRTATFGNHSEDTFGNITGLKPGNDKRKGEL